MELIRSISVNDANDSNIVALLEENNDEQVDNERNLIHSNLQLLTTKNIDNNDENEMTNQHRRPPQDDYYVDKNHVSITNQNGKYSNSLYNRVESMDDTYNKYRLKNYRDSNYRYNEENHDDVRQYYERIGTEFESAIARFEGAKVGTVIGTLYSSVPRTYKSTKVFAKFGYKARKQHQERKDIAQRYYEDAKYKTNKGYKNKNDIANNNVQRIGKKHCIIKSNDINNRDDDDNDYDEEFDDFNKFTRFRQIEIKSQNEYLLEKCKGNTIKYF